MRTLTHNLLGLTLGAIVGWMSTPLFVAELHAQQASKNITSGDGWNICYDVQAAIGQPALTLAAAQALPVQIRFDGATTNAAVTPAWIATATAGVFEIQLPEAQFPASARTNGNHTYALTIGGAAVTLADGTIINAGTTINDTYNIVCKNCGPQIGNPRWKKILGTIGDAMRGAGRMLGKLIPG